MNHNINFSATINAERYLADRDVASILSVSTAWLRKQRYLRKNGMDHILEVDPIYLGRSPRYRESEILNWSGSL